MIRAGYLFSASSVLPVPLLLAAVAFGGVWPWLALIYLTLFAFVLDTLIGQMEVESEFPAAEGLSVALACLHFVVLGAVVWRFGQGVATAEAVGLFLATGLYIGQIGNSNAHELIHRGRRMLSGLGKAVYISLLFGHHVSAHPLVHHRHVATPRDPITARLGEGYYRFLIRAWIGSFRAGFSAEQERRRGDPWWHHPYAHYLGGAVLCLLGALALGGGTGLVAYLLLCLFAQSQLMMSDYVQHYGLQRREVNGAPEAVSDAHSWNAPHVFTSHMMLHAPRHSAHHARPSLRYDALTLPSPAVAPTLPYSLPAMSVIALVPPVWRRLMARELAFWQAEPLTAQAA